MCFWNVLIFLSALMTENRPVKYHDSAVFFLWKIVTNLFVFCTEWPSVSWASFSFPEIGRRPRPLNHMSLWIWLMVCVFIQNILNLTDLFVIVGHSCLLEHYLSFLLPGVPTIHDKGLVDFNGSFSYGTLVNNDGVAPANLPVNLKQPPVTATSTDAPHGPDDLKKDWNNEYSCWGFPHFHIGSCGLWKAKKDGNVFIFLFMYKKTSNLQPSCSFHWVFSMFFSLCMLF